MDGTHSSRSVVAVDVGTDIEDNGPRRGQIGKTTQRSIDVPDGYYAVGCCLNASSSVACE